MKYNYLEQLNHSRNASKFNMIYEAIMNDLEIYKNIEPAKHINKPSLNLILEEIEKPQYIVCESSGRSILLEEAIFMDEDYLITEGILEKVGQKIQQIINWIKEGIKEVLSKAADEIKAFCEKVKNNKVVAAIRKKLGLDEKLKSERFKNFIKVKAGGKEIAAESILDSDLIYNNIISEATKLTKKEEAITDPKELEPLIKKYEDAIAGKTSLKNAKTGKPLSSKYLKERLGLLKKKMASLQPDESKDNIEGGSPEEASGKGEDKKPGNKKKTLGDIHIDVDGIKNTVKSVKDESISEEAVSAAVENSATVIGGDEAANVISGDSNAPESEGSSEEPKKKGLFGKLKDKVSEVTNKVGNKITDKIKSAATGAKKWFNAQNKWVKILICCIIAVLAILAIYFLITAVIYPILYGILNGGIVNAASGIFRIYASGKTFVATYKQGKKSWETGEGWGKTFIMLGLSILAIVNLGQMASQGLEMMGADQAENAASAASAASEGAKDAVGNVGSNIDLVSQSNGMLDSSGNINSVRIAELAKENKIPGFNFNDYLKDYESGDIVHVRAYDIFEKLAENPTYGKYFNLSNMSSIEAEQAEDVLEQFLNKAGKLYIKVK
jgi:hypothetical protein